MMECYEYSMAKVYFLIFLLTVVLGSRVCAQSCNNNSSIHQTSKQILDCFQPMCLTTDAFKDKIKSPEDILKSKLNGVSPEETVTRLIYSEMLASQCSQELSEDRLKQMASGIAAVIYHRVLKLKSISAQDSKEKVIVFEKAQFRSSTGSCDVAKREEFLCPTKYPKWEKVWQMAQDSWKNIKKKDPLDSKAVFYYFPKHFDDSKDCARFKSSEVFEKWKKGKTEVSIENSNKELSECIRFFK